MGPGLEFLEEADILDRDHGLIGKGLEQRDLPLGKRFDLCTGYGDGSDSGALAQHRHADPRAMADDARTLSRALGYRRIFLRVEGLDDTTVPRRARAARRTIPDRSRVGTTQLFERLRRHVVAPSEMEHLSLDEEQRTVEPLAQPHRAPEDGVEHRLHVSR